MLKGGSEALASVKGMGESSAATLGAVALSARRIARGEIEHQPILGRWQSLLDYLAAEGSVDEAAIHPREVIRKAFDIGATALILVHNHPSGDLEPSLADIQITNRIAEAGRLLNITVHDHLIVGRGSHVSLRAKALM